MLLRRLSSIKQAQGVRQYPQSNERDIGVSKTLSLNWFERHGSCYL